MLSVRYSVYGKEGKTVTMLRRLQAKGEMSTLYDKNCFQKKYNIIIYFFQISAVVMVLRKESMIGKKQAKEN